MKATTVALFVSCLWASTSWATPPSSEEEIAKPEPVEIPTVVVEKRRPTEDSAAPATVISREDVTDAMSSLPEILDEQPGLRIQRLGGLESFSTVSIRGSSSDQVLVALDGIPLNAAEGGGVDLSTIPFGPLDRIVVYRGVTPLSFGTSAIGGVVSMHSRTISRPWLEMEAGGGSFGTRMARGFGGSGGDGWGVGVAVDYVGSEGNFSFVDDHGTLFQADDDQTTERKNNAFDQASVLVKTHVDLNATWRLGVIDWFLWRSQGLPGMASAPTEKASLRRMRNLLGFRLHGRPSRRFPLDVAVVPYVSWSQTELSDPLSEAGFGADEIRDQSWVPGMNTTIKWPLFFGDDDIILFSPGLNVAYRYERFMPRDDGASIAYDASERHRLSAALELDVDVAPVETQFLVSGRYESLWNAVHQPENRPIVTDPASNNGDTDAWTFRGGVVNRSLRDTEFRANVSYGVRFPSLHELFGNNGTLLGNPGLDPERGLGLDMGLVYSTPRTLRPNHWSTELFGFARWTEDLIHFVQNAQNISVAQNISSARVFGVEWGTYFDVLRHLRGRGSVTWLHSEDRSDTAARRGKRLPQQPEWKAFVRLEGYVRIKGWVSEMGASAELEFVSGNYRDPANLVAVPERWLLGAGLYVQSQSSGLRLDVTARNLTNDTVLDYTGFPLPGLSVMATLRYTPTMDGLERS